VQRQVERQREKVTLALAPGAWRRALAVHPAADKIPQASDDERKALAGDLAKHGLKVPVVLVSVAGRPAQLLDGRHRLDLLEGTGVKVVDNTGGVLVQHHTVDVADDAEAERLSLSLNAHRRHLSADGRRKLLRAQLVATPEKSDRAIGAIVGYSDKTVTKERRELEGRSEIPNVEAKTDTKGRRQPAKKTKPPSPDDDNEITTGPVTTSVEVAEVNPITAAWDKASEAQRLVFVRDRKDDIEAHCFAP
jgi:ParB-like chromosome segregation protein Spo0J